MVAKSTDLLRRLGLAVYLGKPATPDVKEWFLDGMARYFKGACGLDEALGLRGAGVRGPAYRAREIQRNTELRVAFEHAHGGDEQVGLWKRAGVLAKAIQRTGQGRALAPPPKPDHIVQLEAAIDRARAHGLVLPGSPARLLTIYRETPGFSRE